MIVNQRFASKYWPGEDPLGKRLRLFDGKTPEPWLTVVGVVSNIVQNGRTRPKSRSADLLALPAKAGGIHEGFRCELASRTGGLATAFRHEVQALDSDLPVTYYMSLAERLSWVYGSSRGIADSVPDICRDRAPACFHRTVCRHRAFGEPAHSGDWNSDGHRRDGRARFANSCSWKECFHWELV